MKRTVMILVLAFFAPLSLWAFDGAPEKGRRQGPPAEATEACKGKNAGDEVQLNSPRGGALNAKCREVDGRLVAVPEGGFGSGRRGMPPEDRQ